MLANGKEESLSKGKFSVIIMSTMEVYRIRCLMVKDFLWLSIKRNKNISIWATFLMANSMAKENTNAFCIFIMGNLQTERKMDLALWS